MVTVRVTGLLREGKYTYIRRISGRGVCTPHTVYVYMVFHFTYIHQ